MSNLKHLMKQYLDYVIEITEEIHHDDHYSIQQHASLIFSKIKRKKNTKTFSETTTSQISYASILMNQESEIILMQQFTHQLSQQ